MLVVLSHHWLEYSHKRGACNNSYYNHVICGVAGTKKRSSRSHLWIKFIESFNGSLNIATVYIVLNFLSGADGCVVLMWLQICFLGEFCRRIGVALHRQVVQNQGIDITIAGVSLVNLYRIDPSGRRFDGSRNIKVAIQESVF